MHRIQAFNTATGHYEFFKPVGLAARDEVLKKLFAGPYVNINVDGKWWS
jgi:hypothetical protein